MSENTPTDNIKHKDQASTDKSKSSEPLAQKVKAPAGTTEAALLNGSIEIYPHRPIAKYDSGEVKAYAASHLKSDGDLFALVCEPHLVPRVNASELYESFVNPALPPLVSRGRVYWPPAAAERYVFVYRDVLGNRLKGIDGREAFGWKQEQVLSVVVKPIMSVIQDFQDKDFVHGSIRPSNMFDGGAGSQVKKVLLGDALSTPCSYTQPALYESVERAMASPLGRGKAVPVDDLYSLGVSIAVLMRTNDPMAGFDEAQVIRRKMEVGSYAAVTGKDRFTGSILELLRGLLIDDPAQRWTVEEISLWLDGNRLSPKQAIKVKKAPRPLPFDDKKYFYLPFFAMDIPKNPAELLRVIETEELHQWLGRAFEDDQAILRLNDALKEAARGGKGGNYPERVVTAVSGALDTFAPLRYKGMRLTADAFGNNLANSIVLGHDINPYVELLSSTLLLNWISVSDSSAVDKGALANKMDACRRHLKQSKMGYGIERCLYILAPEVHCLSAVLENYHVRSPEDIIVSFEDMCSKGKAPSLFIDRHSAAFLSVKDSKCIDSHLFDLSAPERHKNVLGNLKTLAIIQNRGKLGPMPELAKAFVKMLSCVYERYHDQNIRETLQKGVERFAQSGDLVKMAALLDNTDIAGKDMSGFKSAMAEYALLREELKDLERKLQDQKSFGKNTGQAIGAVISSAIAGIIIIAVTVMFISGKALF